KLQQMGKKSKHEKKSKKSKKSKSKKRRSSSSSSSSSSGASQGQEAAASYQWEEKDSTSASKPRSDWFASISEQAMEANIFLGSATSSKIRAAEKEQAARELAEHGAGLIINRETLAAGEASGSQPQAPQPPQAQDWYRRAYRRCQEQAREQGRPLEEVAAERWGSLDRLRSLMGSGGGHSEQRSRDGDRQAEQRWKHRRQNEDHEGSSRGSRDGEDRRGDSRRRDATRDDSRLELEDRKSEREARVSDRSDDQQRSGANWRRSEAEDHQRSGANWRRSEADDQQRSGANWRRSEADDQQRSGANWRRSEADDQQRSGPDSRQTKSDEQNRSGAHRSVPVESARAAPPEVETAKPEMVTVEEERHVRQDDINQLSAQILRAQIEGDKVKASKLEKRLAVMREAQRRKLKVRIKQRVAKPASEAAAATAESAAPSKAAPKRPGLNALGASSTIEEMRAHERLIDSRAMQLDFAGAYRPAATSASAADADDPTGEYAEGGKAKRPRQLERASDRDRALAGQKMRATGRRCDLCVEGDVSKDAESAKLTRGLMVECGSRIYLRLPDVRSLVDKHCLLSTVNHVTCCAELDDDAFAELERIKRHLVERLGRLELDCVFVETAKGLSRHPHLLVEAFPLPKEVGESAHIYFNKALMEAGPEWASNKKAVPMRDMDIRRTVPRGFPYLAVEFGRDSGLVHVIEDESAFPDCFGREVIAGMLDLPHELWRKPKRDNWEALLNKASEFRFFWSERGEVVVRQQDD
ncbi:hypothetical protein BOX15_Mlig017469g2, partial [Macrostomum lignano]